MLTVRATIQLLPTNGGGRRSAIASRYLSNVRFRDRFADALVVLVDRQILQPGEACEAEITFAHPELVEKHLVVGGVFELTEGGRKVGQGTIT